MGLRRNQLLSRRHFCLCCMSGAAIAATGGWLTPRQAFAEARGLVTLIKDSAASSPVTAYKLRDPQRDPQRKPLTQTQWHIHRDEAVQARPYRW